jgi:hypothetical protein
VLILTDASLAQQCTRCELRELAFYEAAHFNEGVPEKPQGSADFALRYSFSEHYLG